MSDYVSPALDEWASTERKDLCLYKQCVISKKGEHSSECIRPRQGRPKSIYPHESRTQSGNFENQAKRRLSERFSRMEHFFKTLTPVNLGEIHFPGPLAFKICNLNPLSPSSTTLVEIWSMVSKDISHFVIFFHDIRIPFSPRLALALVYKVLLYREKRSLSLQAMCYTRPGERTRQSAEPPAGPPKIDLPS